MSITAKKLQKPLIVNGQNILPLTSMDQVLTDDEGSRLNETIHQNLAPIELTSTATKAYAVGEFLVYDNLLYRVTSAIALGGTITPGTNCVTDKVGNEIKTIKDALTSDMFKLKAYSFSYSIGAGADFHTAFTPSETGYYAIGIVRYSTNDAFVAPISLNIGSGAYSITLHNFGTGTRSASLQVIVLFYKGTVPWIT